MPKNPTTPTVKQTLPDGLMERGVEGERGGGIGSGKWGCEGALAVIFNWLRIPCP